MWLAQMVAWGYCEQRGKALLRHGQALAANHRFPQALHFLTRAAEDEEVAPLARILTAQVSRLCVCLCVRLCVRLCVFVCVVGGGRCWRRGWVLVPAPSASTLARCLHPRHERASFC